MCWACINMGWTKVDGPKYVGFGLIGLNLMQMGWA